jgi:dTDP-4-amino-4,6-dideoxygalactose transaminase
MDPSLDHIAYSRVHVGDREFDYMRQAIQNAHVSGDGPFTRWCSEWLETELGAARALLVHSCTAALELSAMLLDLAPGDEVIMPSFTFVTTANAVVLQGGVPVFVDIDPRTLCIDPARIEQAITPRTRSIWPVHYAGVACDLDAVVDIATAHDLVVVEDAAQGICASHRGRPLGTVGALGTLSFHETKNVTCGEGGALLINDPELVDRAQILRDKGTNRSNFEQGLVDRYTWVDVGSSFAMSDLDAAFLLAQLEEAEALTTRRLEIWQRYHEAFAPLEAAGRLQRPTIPDDVSHNAHIYWLLAPTKDDRDHLLGELNQRGINAVFHYVPLHSSPAGQRLARSAEPTLPVTDDAWERLVRLPLWVDMTPAMVDRVIESVVELLG